MILLQGLTRQGESINRLFSSIDALKTHCHRNQITILKRKRLFFSSGQKNQLLLRLFSQLQENINFHNSLAESLRYLNKHTDHPICAALFLQLYDFIIHGKNLTSALQRLTIGMPKFIIQLIHQGENNNQLNNALNTIIHLLEEAISQRKTIQKKLSYPSLLIMTLLCFLHFLCIKLFPNILTLYQSLGKHPPLWIGFLKQFKYGLFAIDFVLLILLAIAIWPKKRKRIKHLILARIPLIRSLQLAAERLHWLRLFFLQHSAGVPFSKAFAMATTYCQHPKLKLSLILAKQKIDKGETPSQALLHHQTLPPNWVMAFKLGEHNNTLTALLTKLLQQENTRLLAKIDRLISYIEPGMLIILGGFILLFVIALYAPLLATYSTF